MLCYNVRYTLEKKCYFSHWFNPQMPAPSWGCGEIAEQGTPPRSPTSRPGAQILGPTPAALQYICRKLDQMWRSDSITSTQYGIQEITPLCYNTHKQSSNIALQMPCLGLWQIQDSSGFPCTSPISLRHSACVTTSEHHQLVRMKGGRMLWRPQKRNLGKEELCGSHKAFRTGPREGA